MGQFSWLYSDTGQQMLDDYPANSYLLVPPPFEGIYGKHIKEEYYDGYGHFGKYDVYELVAYWNRGYIPEILNDPKWRLSSPLSQEDKDNMLRFYHGEQLECPIRHIGIFMACYDEDNFRLPYPIKITEKPTDYHNAEPSKSDPFQGWGHGNVYDEYEKAEWIAFCERERAKKR